MIKNRVAGAIVVVAAAAVACGGGPGGHPGAYQGVVEFDERHLGFEIGGRLRDVKVDEGDAVAPGQVLAALDDAIEQTAHRTREQEAAAARAQTSLVRAGARAEEIRSMAAQVEAARAQEQLLATNLAREQRLMAEGASTSAAVQDLEARHRAAVADVRALEERLRSLRNGSRAEEVEGAEARAGAAASAVDMASERLRLYELRAVEAGTVLDVNADPGEVVAPGTPVVTVADTRHPYADVFVPQGALDGIAVGTAAEIAVDSLARPLSGRVEHVARRTEFTPRYLFSEKERPNLVVRVRVRIDDPRQELHAGVPAFANFTRRAPVARKAP
ncbi:MAG TPA: HlyD family efflux transporter periplasmic adaptor subunit [Candidatus Acidoferrum sp.]|nr:HlyD family efflux transporter periplasmic adaptor subunit [Candidatus Acidoferrum sp.]